MPLPINYKKSPNTNQDTTSGTFVEAVNPPVGPIPPRFVGDTNQYAKVQRTEMHIAFQANRTMVAPDGTVWPVVDIDNSDFRNPQGDGSEYDHISTDH